MHGAAWRTPSISILSIVDKDEGSKRALTAVSTIEAGEGKNWKDERKGIKTGPRRKSRSGIALFSTAQVSLGLRYLSTPNTNET